MGPGPGPTPPRPSAGGCARGSRKELCLRIASCPPPTARDVLCWPCQKGTEGLFVLRRGHREAVKRFPMLPLPYIREVACGDQSDFQISKKGVRGGHEMGSLSGL